jgi:cytochrome b involved in lipid metabolism
MTDYIRDHPGGNAMLRVAGADATIAIRMVNSHNIARDFIDKKLKQLCIGELATNQRRFFFRDLNKSGP